MSRNDFSLYTVSFAAALAYFFGLAEEPSRNTGLLLIFIALIFVMLAHLSIHLHVQKLSHVLILFAVGFAWAQFATWAQHRATAVPA